MKESILLYKTKIDNYLPIKKNWDNNSLSQLFSLLFGDFRPWDTDFLTRAINCYNVNFIYHNFETQMLYIGQSEWELDEDMMCPNEEEFPNYVNETNSCKMHVNNFLEFREQWIEIKKALPNFAIIYRDNLDWVHCKGFNIQAEMELFVENNQREIIH